MVYITSTGERLERRPPAPLWRLPITFFLGVIDLVVLFFTSMLAPAPRVSASVGGVVKRAVPGRNAPPPPPKKNTNIAGLSSLAPPACVAKGG
jgi:hypothetical protein